MYNPQLETFIQVSDAGSFNKAAEQLFVTPTAVIKQINLLEQSLDVTLFNRTKRGISLTDAGKSLYNDSKYIIEYCKESVARAKNAEQKSLDCIRIGTSPMTPTQFLVDLFPKVHEEYPNIKLEFIPFENTPENAREILKNLGKNIDVVAGIFDDLMLDVRECAGFEISREPICAAVSIHHRLASKKRLNITDLYGERFMLIRRGWSSYVDFLRDELWQKHPQIEIVDFDFYSTKVFNQCENSNDLLMAIEKWSNVHPLLKIIPIDWDYAIPFGFLHSPMPSKSVKKFLSVIQKVL